MKIAVVGSRTIEINNLEEYLPEDTTTIVSGGAKGVDSSASEYAKKMGIELIEHLPDYKLYGRGAPIVRNRLIVEDCDILYAFWDGKSKGTKYTIDYARKMGKEVVIIKLEDLQAQKNT